MKRVPALVARPGKLSRRGQETSACVPRLALIFPESIRLIYLNRSPPATSLRRWQAPGAPHLPQSAEVGPLTLAGQIIAFPIIPILKSVTFPPILADFAQPLTIPLSQPAKPFTQTYMVPPLRCSGL
jgi:hypothetical protein